MSELFKLPPNTPEEREIRARAFSDWIECISYIGGARPQAAEIGTDGDDFQLDDLRCLVANQIACRVVAAMPAPTTWDEFRAFVDHVGDLVGSQLGETRAAALSDFVLPMVFDEWRFRLT